MRRHIPKKGGYSFTGIYIPLGDPHRVCKGFAIPASWSVTLMPRVGKVSPTFACSCETLGIGPMSKEKCFDYIKANQPDEFYTVPIPHGDLRRTVMYGKGGNCSTSIPSSWIMIMTPITKGPNDRFLCVNEALEPTLSFTSRKRCIAWILKNTPWEIAAITLPLGDPRRTFNYSSYKGCVPPASWTVLIDPENTMRYYEKDVVSLTDTTNT